MGQWNAYESWLGLSLGGRAPSHYELLGLPTGAPQPAALRQAVLQRMAKVRPYQSGKHGEEATRLLNELAEAAVVLGDPRRRAAYDASLAGQKLTQEQASALEGGDWWESGGSLVDPFLEQLVGEMQQQTSPLLLQPRKRRPAWYWPAVGGAGVAGVLLLILVVASLGGGDSPDPVPPIVVPTDTDPEPSPPIPPEPSPLRPPLLAYPATPAECQAAQQQWAEFLQMPVQLSSGVAGIELALIPAGQFWMGSPEWEEGRNAEVETPAATTLTRPFYLGATEVTRAEWRTVMEFEPKEWREPGTTSRWPVTYVSWPDAEKFCELLTQREREMGLLRADWSYALPTEAQWEFACRSGSVGRYCCGENVELLKRFAFFSGGSRSGVQEVGLLQSNAYGLFDMHGNDQEWCRDWYTQRLPGGVDPYQAASGGDKGRSVRGGVAGGGPKHERTAHRNWSWYPPEYGDLWTGFRVALVPDATAIPGEPPATIPELPPLTRAQTADASRTCAELADNPAHSRWLIRPGELGGAEWSYEMTHFTPDILPRTGSGPTPFLEGKISGVPLGTVWPTHRLRAAIRIQMPPLTGQRIVLRVIYDSDLRISANGRPVRSFPDHQHTYSDVGLTPAEQAVFRPGENEVVIECTGDGRPDWSDVCDLGLRLVPEPAAPASVPPPAAAAAAPPESAEPAIKVTYVSDLEFVDPDNSHGHIERDRSNGENAPADGRPLTLNGVPYDKGLGVHARSSVTFNLNGEYDRFQAFVGLDDESRSAGSVGSVVFRVYGDGPLPLAESGLLGPQSEAHHIDVSVQGVQQMRLEVTDGGDNTRYDHADWADAKLLWAAPGPSAPAPADPLADVEWIIPPGKYGGSDWQGVMTDRAFEPSWFTSDIPNALTYFSPFGTPDSVLPGAEFRNIWATKHLYLQTSFQLPSLQGKRVSLYVIHNDDAWLYVNGKPLSMRYYDKNYLQGYSTWYETVTLSREATAQFQEGRNELFVYVVGGPVPNVFDLGLRLVPAAD